MRCLHEAQLHNDNCFITLTYDQSHLSDDSLHVDHYQKFMKRLRKRFSDVNIRYFHCGEYGEKNGRPHYHACLFGFDFPDKVLWQTREGNRLYTSQILNEVWGKGYCVIGEVTFDSAAYVARYIVKKLLGASQEQLDAHYGGKTPEYTTMSRRPGIGRGWYDKYKNDLYPHDYAIVNEKEVRPPKYYDKIFEVEDPQGFAELKESRRLRNGEMVPKHLRLQGRISKIRDSDPYDRLPVKETVSKAKITLKKREL